MPREENGQPERSRRTRVIDLIRVIVPPLIRGGTQVLLELLRRGSH